MHLVLRSDSGESITLEVLQNDTFVDLANRLYEQGKISVDLKQLRTDSRPFAMTANVIEYFGSKKGIRRKENQELHSDMSCEAVVVPPEVTSVTMMSDSDSVVTATSTVTAVTTTVTTTCTNVSSPPTTCTSSSITSAIITTVQSDVDESLIFPEMKLTDQKYEKPDNSLRDEIKLETFQRCISPPVKYCRLCACAIAEDSKFIFDSSISENSDSDGCLADKINESLPILVSKEDELPKQICLPCVESLNASHEFTKKVTAADDLLKRILYEKGFEVDSTGGGEEKCPLCCDGSMKVVQLEELPLVKDEHDSYEDDNYDDQWGNGYGDADDYEEYDDDDDGSYLQQKKRGRPRGSRSYKRHYPWDDLDDEDWTLKEETVVKKRGRPKGSKNRSNQQEQPVQCCLCLTWYSDIQALLAHTLEVHCEDETGIFPCPLCHAIQPDEGELIHHVTNHNTVQPPMKVKMWGCPLCGQAYDGPEELGNHLLSDHVQAASPQYQCPLCDHAPTSGSRLANHITDSHCGPPTWNCPLCDEAHEGKQSAFDHVVRSHVSMAAQTTQCPLCEMQFITDEEMAQHLLNRHSSPHIAERPFYYSCTACNSRFKSQYNLIKHTCPVRNNKKYKKSYSKYY